MNNQETQDREPPMAHTRHEDPPGLRVSRDIPLPWLIGIVFALIVQAAMMYYQLNAVVDAQAKTTVEIEKLRAFLSMPRPEFADVPEDAEGGYQVMTSNGI